MASTPKQVNGNASPSNGPLGKRKKSKGSKSSYLSKWLDKTMHHIQESAPDGYENQRTNLNWSMCQSPFIPGYDSHRSMYGPNEPMSLPTLPVHYNPMMHHYPEYRPLHFENKSIQVQRPRIRRRSKNRAEELSSIPADVANQNYMQPKNFSDSQDFASLPPIVTSTGDTNSNSDLLNDKDDGSNNRRYSDPCMRGIQDADEQANGESDSESSSGLSGSQVGSRLLSYLLDQITSLKMVNERLNKELQETRAELDSYQPQSFYTKGGTNIGAGGGQYSPGYLTELVREIRDATRIREEAMYARLRSLVLERTDITRQGISEPVRLRLLQEKSVPMSKRPATHSRASWPVCLLYYNKKSGSASATSESKVAERNLEEIKASLRASEADKRCMVDRINKLEDELRILRVSNSLEDSRMSNGTSEEESERIRLRREVAELRKAKQNSDENVLKLERLVTQLRSKFNGIMSNGPDSIPSDHDEVRTRRTSANSTFMCGPVTDL